jgi:hypothetical protein
MNWQRTHKRDRNPLIPSGFSTGPQFDDVGISGPETQEERWRRAEGAFEQELQSIKAVARMPLDRWARWDKERAAQFCVDGEGGKNLQKKFREEDRRVLGVMEAHKKQRITVEDVPLSISLCAKVEEVFLKANIGDSELMRMISPPHKFPWDQIGKCSSNKSETVDEWQHIHR